MDRQQRSSADLLRSISSGEPRVEVGGHNLPLRFNVIEILNLPYHELRQIVDLFVQLHPQHQETVRLQTRTEELRRQRVEAEHQQILSQQNRIHWGRQASQIDQQMDRALQEFHLAQGREVFWRNQRDQLDRQILLSEQEALLMRCARVPRREAEAPRSTSLSAQADLEHRRRTGTNAQNQYTPELFDRHRPERHESRGRAVHAAGMLQRSRSANPGMRSSMGNEDGAYRYGDTKGSSNLRPDTIKPPGSVRRHSPPSSPPNDRFAKRPRKDNPELRRMRETQSSRPQETYSQPQRMLRRPQSAQVLNGTFRNDLLPLSVPSKDQIERILDASADPVDSRAKSSLRDLTFEDDATTDVNDE